MEINHTVAVYGAYGHTGRFVVEELCKRGWMPLLCGRDADRLASLQQQFPELPQRVAAIDDAAALDGALDGAVAVINCAGPFLDTARPLIEAALRAGIHYLDVCAEQRAVQEVWEHFDAAAQQRGVTLLPAMAFYGGLADLLVTATLDDWPDAERIDIAVALDSWHPTAGTRLTGARNTWPRLVVSEGHLQPLPNPAPTRDWNFPPPFGNQAMIALPFTETITISRHVRCTELHSWLNLAPLRDVRDAATPAPVAVDEHGRSAQQFMLDVVVQRNGETRRATLQGQDIYAISAPLVVEALQRIVSAKRSAGVVSAGAAFDARDFLAALPGVTRVVVEPI